MEQGCSYLTYTLYTTNSTPNELILKAVVDDIKDFVFDGTSLNLREERYNVLSGKVPLSDRRDDLWKIIETFREITSRFEQTAFSIYTDDPRENLFYRECERNDLVPEWITDVQDFNRRLFLVSGSVHVVTPDIEDKYPNSRFLDIVREHSSETRNVLVTEAVRQRIHITSVRKFGMQSTSVRIPVDVAYVGRERPDLLSSAVREFFKNETSMDLKALESRLNGSEMVMVHVKMNSKDWKAVTGVADIEQPRDIVSHRVSLAMLYFDEKYSMIPNGLPSDQQHTYTKVQDKFERERLNSLMALVVGRTESLAHRYQTAKSLVTHRHITECRRVFLDDDSDKEDTGDEQEKAERRKHKKAKTKGKRTLAAIQAREIPVPPPVEEEEPRPTSRSVWRHFERAVNGDDVYEGSSDENSLCEEDGDWFERKPKKQTPLPSARQEKSIPIHDGTASDNDDAALDLRELLSVAPPLASKDIEDFDDI